MLKELVEYVVEEERNRAEELQPLTTNNLSCLIGYVVANPDGHKVEELIIHVVSPWRVDLVSTLCYGYARNKYMTATVDKLDRMSFGRHMLMDEFKENIRRMFLYSENIDATINSLSKVAALGHSILDAENFIPFSTTFAEINTEPLAVLLSVRKRGEQVEFSLHDVRRGGRDYEDVQAIKTYLQQEISAAMMGKVPVIIG